MGNANSSFAVCTIIASNYVSRALVLHDSLKAFHPEVDFWVLLIDDAPLGPLSQKAVDRRGFHILRVNELQLPPVEIDNFRFAYDLTEVSTAYKPWTIDVVARRSGYDVFYIDPDIQFFGPMTDLLEAVKKHELVLTPHVLHPMKRDGCQPSESDIMGSGIYNLGFLGVNHGANRVIEWWEERLKRECYSAPEQQRFTDQRWIDFAPSLFDCYISKDETVNVAYWNADQRPVVLKDGQYLIRNKPLTFFHYSGLSEKAPHLLTRHHGGRPRVLLSDNPAITTLAGDYIKLLQAAEQECADLVTQYPYNCFPDGGTIALSLRRLFLRALVSSEKENLPAPQSPFGPEGEAPFLKWLFEPLKGAGVGIPVPRLVLLLRELRPDLMAAFPDPTGRDAVRLVEWFRMEGPKQFSLPARFIPSSIGLDHLTIGKKLVPGLEIIGYLRTESGVGQAARLLAGGLKGSSVPFETLIDTTAPSRQEDPFQDQKTNLLSREEAFDCCVLCVNADSVASVRRRLGRNYFHNRHIAGLWFWEVETFPKSMHSAFEEVDEVWVASKFIRDALGPISPVPVHHIPLPFGIAQQTQPIDRLQWGIPQGFFFLFTFDFHSVFQRKNPLGLIEAFKRAFNEGEGPSLVIKGINGDAHMTELEHLRFAARNRRDIIILSNYMEATINQALIAACDCYVSLHRSEGLGLTMAEAMTQSKPVIATAYSGNMDFMTEENSYLCRFAMTSVGAGAAPYPASAVWAEPDVQHAAELMKRVYSQPEEATRRGQLAALDLAERFSPQQCAIAIEERWQILRSRKTVEHLEVTLPMPMYSALSTPVKKLRKQWKRPLDLSKTVPSFGSMLFQGPRKILQKMLLRIERHRQTFDEAVVATACDHDKRLASLERSCNELREQNIALMQALEAEKNNRSNTNH